MNKVIAVYEECHDLIAVANSCFCAVNWLIKDNWLTLDMDIWDREKATWTTIREQFGDDAFEHLFLLTINEFNELFEGCFLLVEMDVV